MMFYNPKNDIEQLRLEIAALRGDLKEGLIECRRHCTMVRDEVTRDQVVRHDSALGQLMATRRDLENCGKVIEDLEYQLSKARAEITELNNGRNKEVYGRSPEAEAAKALKAAKVCKDKTSLDDLFTSAKDFKVSPIYNRLMNSLDIEGIRLVRDLVSKNRKQIAKFPNIGKKCMGLLDELMAKHNLKFA